MSPVDILLGFVGLPVAQLLLKRYLGSYGDLAGKGLADIVKKAVAERNLQREAETRFANLGDRVALQLVPLFEREQTAGNLNVEAMARELGRAAPHA